MATSPNVLKSGLDAASQFVQGESPQEFAQLQAEYFDYYAPTTPDQRFQVDNLVRNEWLLRRLHRVESHLWEYQIRQTDRASGVELGEAFTRANTIFMRLQRRITAAEKAHKEAKAELDRLHKLAQPQPVEAETGQLASFLTPATREDGPDVAIAKMDLLMRQHLAESS